MVDQDRAARLREAREGAGFSKASEAAVGFNWSKPTYHAHENGSRGIRVAVGRRYARAFGVKFNWLYFNEPDRKIHSEGVGTASGSQSLTTIDFADRLRVMRKDIGVKSAEAFAVKGGFEPDHYKAIEAGTVPATVDDLVKIAGAMPQANWNYLILGGWLPHFNGLESSSAASFTLHDNQTPYRGPDEPTNPSAPPDEK